MMGAKVIQLENDIEELEDDLRELEDSADEDDFVVDPGE